MQNDTDAGRNGTLHSGSQNPNLILRSSRNTNTQGAIRVSTDDSEDDWVQFYAIGEGYSWPIYADSLVSKRVASKFQDWYCRFSHFPVKRGHICPPWRCIMLIWVKLLITSNWIGSRQDQQDSTNWQLGSIEYLQARYSQLFKDLSIVERPSSCMSSLMLNQSLQSETWAQANGRRGTWQSGCLWKSQEGESIFAVP